MSIIVACGDRSNGERLLVQALDHIESNALASAETDWQSLRPETIARAGDSPEASDAHDAIRFALRALNDGHSHLLTPEDLAGMESAASEAATAIRSPEVVSAVLDDSISYLRVPSFVGSSSERMTSFADSVQERIAAVDSLAVCGWIVDLRNNSGGNVWPMLAGIGPLLGTGTASYFVDADGSQVDIWYRNGTAGIKRERGLGLPAEVIQAAVSAEPYRLVNSAPAIAVIIGPGTASSGELIAISFIGRADTATLGSTSAGLTTNNDSLPLDDGSVLVLATSVMADRGGRTYGGQLEPDFRFDAEAVDLPLATQSVVVAATRWLKDQAPCL